MGNSRQVFKFAAINIAIILVTIALFAATHVTLLLFIPLMSSVTMMFLVSLSAAPGIILSYVAFDGMLKILSNYNSIIHVSADLLVLVLGLRWLILVGRSGHRIKFAHPPLLLLFLVHVAWVAVEIVNPYGLGIIPGLASYKVYVSFLSLYFFMFLAVEKPEELVGLLKIICLIMVIQVVSSIYQFQAGEHSLLVLSPHYAKPIGQQFTGIFFRPFGTTGIPGGPTVWCFLSMPLMLVYFLLTKSRWTKLFLFAIFLAGLYVMFICQVRSTLLRVPLGLGVTFTAIYWGKPRQLMVGFICAVLFLASYKVLFLFDSSSYKVARQRLEQLGNVDYIMSARGFAVREKLLYIINNEPFGIGLSRTGAAGNAFKEQIALDPFFGSEWAFADNLYIALAVELGVPGALFYLGLVYLSCGLVLFRLLWYRGPMNHARFFAAGAAGLAVASISGHWGSEGSLYLPECAFYWIFMGAAMRLSGPEFLLKAATPPRVAAVKKGIARKNENNPKILEAGGRNLGAVGAPRR